MSDIMNETTVDFTNRTKEEFAAWAKGWWIKKLDWGDEITPIKTTGGFSNELSKELFFCMDLDGSVPYVGFFWDQPWHRVSRIEADGEGQGRDDAEWVVNPPKGELKYKTMYTTGQSEQVDTSTKEGWNKVVKHWMDGGEIEVRTLTNGWQPANDEHPMEWELTDGYTEYRIKPQRVPLIGDVWEYSFRDIDGTIKEGVCAILKPVGYAFKSLIKQGDSIDILHVERNELIKFTGHRIDLSVLDPTQGGE